VIRVAAAVTGRRGRYRASAHVRVLRRLDHPLVRRRVAGEVVAKTSALTRGRSDLVLVQRTAVPGEHVEVLLSALRRRGTPLVVDLDDNLFLKPRDDLQYGPHLDSLARLLEAASLVMVSTERLGAALSGRTSRIAVVPNALDERLWRPPPPRERPAGAPRLLFVGSKTHGHDLALLRPPLERLAREGVSARLVVVGGEPETGEQRWYTRLAPPPGVEQYPGFVPWLKKHAPQFDIGLAPLADDEFNAVKSDLKFLDYSALGLAGVYSDVPAFESCAHERTGLKTPNTVDGWLESLVRLCADEGLRTSLAEAAQAYVFSERCLVHSAEAYVDLLVDAARRGGGGRLRRLGRALLGRLPAGAARAVGEPGQDAPSRTQPVPRRSPRPFAQGSEPLGDRVAKRRAS
jgi:glycosyltransferase involved in cell wall biosynthesis